MTGGGQGRRGNQRSRCAVGEGGVCLVAAEHDEEGGEGDWQVVWDRLAQRCESGQAFGWETLKIL